MKKYFTLFLLLTSCNSSTKIHKYFQENYKKIHYDGFWFKFITNVNNLNDKEWWIAEIKRKEDWIFNKYKFKYNFFKGVAKSSYNEVYNSDMLFEYKNTIEKIKKWISKVGYDFIYYSPHKHIHYHGKESITISEEAYKNYNFYQAYLTIKDVIKRNFLIFEKSNPPPLFENKEGVGTLKIKIFHIYKIFYDEFSDLYDKRRNSIKSNFLLKEERNGLAYENWLFLNWKKESILTVNLLKRLNNYFETDKFKSIWKIQRSYFNNFKNVFNSLSLSNKEVYELKLYFKAVMDPHHLESN